MGEEGTEEGKGRRRRVEREGWDGGGWGGVAGWAKGERRGGGERGVWAELW